MSGTVLLTGCSSGIGLDAARVLQARGWTVIATCRKPADVAARRAEGMESFPLDIADPRQVREGAARALDMADGRLDALVNNAAFAIPGAVEDLPRGALREIFETNLFGSHDLTCAVLPAMRRAGTGRIANISSVLGLVGIRWRGAYVATKFALEGLSDVLRLEMQGTGIRVILIEPGPITSRIRQNSIPHFERWVDWRASARREQYETGLLQRLYRTRGPDFFELPPSAVSRVLVHALESRHPRPRYYVTKPTWLMGTARRMLPTRMLDWMARQG